MSRLTRAAQQSYHGVTFVSITSADNLRSSNMLSFTVSVVMLFQPRRSCACLTRRCIGRQCSELSEEQSMVIFTAWCSLLLGKTLGMRFRLASAAKEISRRSASSSPRRERSQSTKHSKVYIEFPRASPGHSSSAQQAKGQTDYSFYRDETLGSS